MGAHLLPETRGVGRQVLAAALAESLLLAGRIEFFDLQRPDEADRTFIQALQAAGEARRPSAGLGDPRPRRVHPRLDEQREQAADR